MKKHEFTQAELTSRAFKAYSNEDGNTYMQEGDRYYIYYGGSLYQEIGTLEEVNAYFEEIAEAEDE